MTIQKRFAVFDSDSHVVEPRDVWEQYLEPEYRERGIRFRVGEDDVEYIDVDGQTLMRRAPTGVLGGIGGYPNPNGDRTPLFDPHTRYLDGAPPGSMDPHERIQVLDQEGIDVALLYPTIGIIWEESVADPKLAWEAAMRERGGNVLNIASITLTPAAFSGEFITTVLLSASTIFPP